MNRRDFIRNATGLSGAVIAPGLAGGLSPAHAAPTTTRVAFVKTRDRAAGVARAIDLLALDRLAGRDVFVKPNLNSADPAPGSTHPDVLAALMRKLEASGAGPITVGDRSGMGDTREVMEKTQVFRIAKEHRAKAVVFDELRADEWELVQLPESHWQQGFALPRMVRSAGAVVQACCLKTHRYGGHFTLSLKNSVGLAAKRVPGNPHDFMRELHTSSHQRTMIAEINAAYRPALVVLRHFGTTPEVSRGKIFAQEQIARAAELGLGVRSPEAIELVTGDRESAGYAKRIRAILDGAPGA